MYGRSLLTIRDIIGSGEDTERKIEALQEAVGVLKSDRAEVEARLRQTPGPGTSSAPAQ